MRFADAFRCSICGKPLGARRARQGVTAHPGCRRALPPAEVDRALGLAQATLARLTTDHADAELRTLVRQAAAQAAALIGDLQQLKSYVGGRPSGGSNDTHDTHDTHDRGAGARPAPQTPGIARS